MGFVIANSSREVSKWRGFRKERREEGEGPPRFTFGIRRAEAGERGVFGRENGRKRGIRKSRAIAQRGPER